MGALGVGALSAGLSLGGFGGSAPRPMTIAVSAAVACSGLVGLSFTRWFWLAALLLVITGFAGTLAVAGCNTSLQLMAPDALRGRVMSLYTLLSGGVFPIGAFVVGFVSEHWGVPRAFLTQGALGLVALAALLIWWRHGEQERRAMA
jgi:predicted MFS family arabinose efflux permease